MKRLIQNKLFAVKMRVRNKNHSSAKWEIRTVRVETKLDDTAIFAASSQLKEEYRVEDGWEIDFVSAEVVVV